MALSFLLNSLYKDGFVNFSDSTLNFFSDIGDVALLIKYWCQPQKVSFLTLQPLQPFFPLVFDYKNKLLEKRMKG